MPNVKILISIKNCLKKCLKSCSSKIIWDSATLNKSLWLIGNRSSTHVITLSLLVDHALITEKV